MFKSIKTINNNICSVRVGVRSVKLATWQVGLGYRASQAGLGRATTASLDSVGRLTLGVRHQCRHEVLSCVHNPPLLDTIRIWQQGLITHTQISGTDQSD